jgi:hypothetical protein
LVSSVPACTVYVSKPAQFSTPPNGSAYLEVWRNDWSNIAEASAPWNPTHTDAGACNVGSHLSCVATDHATLPDLEQLENDLMKVSVPAVYSAATSGLLQALGEEVTGLQARDTAIANEDQALFKQAQSDLRLAAGAMTAAYQMFPDSSRPEPDLFGLGRYGS